MRRLHEWYDGLPESRRFMLFLFGVVMPFVLALSVPRFVHTLGAVVCASIVIILISALGLSRVRYITYRHITSTTADEEKQQ